MAKMNNILFNWSMPKETLTEKVSKLTASAMIAGWRCRFSRLLSSSCSSMCIPINASRTPDSRWLHTEKSSADQSPMTKPTKGSTMFRNATHSARTSLPFRNWSNDNTTTTSIVVTLAANISNNELTSQLPHPSILCACLGGHSYPICCCIVRLTLENDSLSTYPSNRFPSAAFNSRFMTAAPTPSESVAAARMRSASVKSHCRSAP